MGLVLDLHSVMLMVHNLEFVKDFLLGPHLEFVMDRLLEEHLVFEMEM